MLIKTNNKTSSGALIPVEFQVKRVSPDRVMKYQTEDKEERNGWCNAGGCNCAKYGCRPCCPPKMKLFNAIKPRKFFYAISVKIVLDDYYEVYPNVKASKSWCYFGMDGTHKMTRNLNNKLVTLLHEQGDQGFRVGGCLGCQYAKTGKCKLLMPPLEATGVNVVEFAKDVFEQDIVWREAKQPMPHMIAIGGIYTDREISSKSIKQTILQITGGRKNG